MIYHCPVTADGSVEVTQAINGWIQSIPWAGVASFAQGGLYWTDGTILGKSGISYVGNGATFQRRTQSAYRDYPHWLFDGCTDFVCFDLNVVGEADPAVGYDAHKEAQHAFAHKSTQRSLFVNCTAKDVWGDFFNFHSNASLTPTAHCQVNRCWSLGTIHRQQVAMTFADDIMFKDCRFGAGCRSGVDLEPVGNKWRITKVEFVDCVWQSHRFNLMSAVPRCGVVEDVTLYRCTTGSPLQVAVACDPTFVQDGVTARRANFTVDSCTCSSWVGNPSGAAMTFTNVDGEVTVTNNVIPLQTGRTPAMRVARWDQYTADHAQITYEGNTKDLG